ANSYINPKLAKSARAINTTGATSLDTKDLEIPNHGTVTFTDYSSYYNTNDTDLVSNCFNNFTEPFWEFVHFTVDWRYLFVNNMNGEYVKYVIGACDEGGATHQRDEVHFADKFDRL
ncbi:MAG: hypothetical protein IKT41_04000, partial [Clostridia bacterium]|nr:hypothetical protein [Clostridia bacterium]